MTARHPATRLLAVTGVLLATAITGIAGAAGATRDGTGGGGLGGPGAAPTANPSAPVSASGDGLTLQTTSSAVQHGALVLTGTASNAAGETLEIESRAATPQALWQTVLTTTVSSTGTFHAVWRSRQSGQVTLRALVAATGSEPEAATAPPTLTVTVYPRSKATIYGPGFYGRRTACGGRLIRSTIGVANRSLPCGTEVSLLFDGRTLSAPVIDRGPFANGASFDLTTATAAALGMPGTEELGALPLSASAASPALP